MVVDGLDRGDRVDADAFVGDVQADVGDAEACGCWDAEADEVVADVGRVGDLRSDLQVCCFGAVEQRGA